MPKIGFIGTGNMGSALAQAAAKCTTAEILLNDALHDKAEALANELSAKAVTLEEICSTAEYIFVGVKPQVISSVLSEMAKHLINRTDRYVIVSMAAGISTAKIGEMLGFAAPIVRIMPNLPVSVGQGMVLYCQNGLAEYNKINELVNLMRFSGAWDEISENLIDAASALSGCGPAFVFMYIDALAKGGENCGLSREKALKYAVQTAIGSAKMLLDTSADPTALRDAVCSPAGSTIEGVKSLQSDNLEEIVAAAIDKSYKRTKELGK